MFYSKKEIKDWLIKYKVENYQINDDLTVDVLGDLQISSKSLREIPFQFGEVKFSFDCSNNQLTSTDGFPRKVGNHYFCSHNQLTSLRGVQAEINGDFYCGINLLSSLEYGPIKVSGGFGCNKNKLTSLAYSPDVVGGDFFCAQNDIVNLEDFKTYFSGKFHHSMNRIKIKEIESFYSRINEINLTYKELNSILLSGQLESGLIKAEVKILKQKI